MKHPAEFEDLTGEKAIEIALDRVDRWTQERGDKRSTDDMVEEQRRLRLGDGGETKDKAIRKLAEIVRSMAIEGQPEDKGNGKLRRL
jgi:hypothetical protein